MSRFNLYYDESEHSRQLTLRTITANNYSDNFIVIVLAWDEENEKTLASRYSEFEEKYSKRKSKGEIKSTSLKQKQFKYGLASLPDQNLPFLEDYLHLFNQNIQVYLSVSSKFEYLINQVLREYKSSESFSREGAVYIITKALNQYMPREVIESLYPKTSFQKKGDPAIDTLLNFFSERIKADYKNPGLKQKEIQAYSQIHAVLSLVKQTNQVNHLDWDYDIALKGLLAYLKHHSIDDYSLTIDREEKTGESAEHLGLQSVELADSEHCFGIRMADMLAGIVDRLLKALHAALRYDSLDDGIHEKHLTNNWFHMNDHRLNLYKTLNNIIMEPQSDDSKRNSGIYADDLILITSLLKMMEGVPSADELLKISNPGEKFDELARKELKNHLYKHMWG
ncbi:hypothetical protein KIM372_14260 [Bombiscardovia nodaiensis]|uniref:DUF3800 domain-containing protein n=1 Tax=Bombiscardovia nodaiensis TaxID=2932181 RepID=A0ABM8B9E6_9BIFI|nr:hypothetical protein KIM372_14260 [Bombiscardovia nodaiensis]